MLCSPPQGLCHKLSHLMRSFSDHPPPLERDVLYGRPLRLVTCLFSCPRSVADVKRALFFASPFSNNTPDESIIMYCIKVLARYVCTPTCHHSSQASS